jgi:hypothetical protein
MQAGVLGTPVRPYRHSSTDFGQAPKPRIPAVRPTAVVNDVPSAADAANHRCVPAPLTPLESARGERSGSSFFWRPCLHAATWSSPYMRSFTVCRRLRPQPTAYEPGFTQTERPVVVAIAEIRRATVFIKTRAAEPPGSP